MLSSCVLGSEGTALGELLGLESELCLSCLGSEPRCPGGTELFGRSGFLYVPSLIIGISELPYSSLFSRIPHLPITVQIRIAMIWLLP